MQSNTEDIYNTVLRSYVQSVPKELLLTKQGVDIFLNLLKEQGYADNTIKLYFFSLKTSFKRNNLEIDFGEAPKVREGEIVRHYYTKDKVITLIQAAREFGGIYAKAMALSTTYGLRRTELSNLKLKDFKPDLNTINVLTAKGGRPTEHLVPEEIMPYINNNIAMKSLATMSRVFNRIAESVNLKEDESGWHSIRRSLVSNLVRACDHDKVIRFMRWKTRTMLDIYHIKDPTEDLYILENHPFLKYWRT